jgi:hypothetical protein
VQDVEPVLQQIGEKLKSLPDRQVPGPLDRPYGHRELMIPAPDGNLGVFGHQIEQPS